MMKLKDKITIITGAGRSIGKAIALAFAKEGADLTVVSRTLAEVEQTDRETEEFGVRVLPLKVERVSGCPVTMKTTMPKVLLKLIMLDRFMANFSSLATV